MANPSSRTVLLSSLVLPGSGHVWLGIPTRGLIFLFFMVVFGWLSHRLMPDTASFIGRNIGGVLVYGLSVIDAYKTARIREIEKS
jgi:hypothetical protein